MSLAAKLKSRNFIFKITSICNLNCSYCYMFNMGDDSYLRKSKIMPFEIAEKGLQEIIEYAQRNDTKSAKIVLHGGEPLLAGKEWIDKFISKAKELTPDNIHVEIAIQTNGTLLNQEWIEYFNKHDVGIGISIDGPEEFNDRYRVDHAGRGSYEKVRNAIDLLVNTNDQVEGWGVLTVANPEFSGVEIYKHLKSIGVKSMDFLYPDYHYDNIPEWKPGSIAKYYIEIFDQWYQDADESFTIRWFNSVLSSLLIGGTKMASIGLEPLTDVIIETDGSLEPYDA